jgi:hypothetical protein
MGLEKIVTAVVLVSCSEYHITEKKEKIPEEEYKEDTAEIQYQETCVATDTFVIHHDCVDIVAVVDSSNSMYDETNNEISRVTQFLDYFTKNKLQEYPDPRMVVISAETNVQSYANSPIKGEDAQTTRWNIEETQGTTEMPFEALMEYIRSDAGVWIRDDCSLEIQMFSDEDDQSYTGYTDNVDDDNEAVAQFLSELGAEEGVKRVYFSVAINPTENYLCSLMVEENQVGYRYEQVAAYYAGETNDLCSAYSDWKTNSIPKTEYTGWDLTYIPIPESLVIYINDSLATNACSYSDGVVTYPYEENLPNGTEVEISYEVDTAKYGNECPW